MTKSRLRNNIGKLLQRLGVKEAVLISLIKMFDFLDIEHSLEPDRHRLKPKIIYLAKEILKNSNLNVLEDIPRQNKKRIFFNLHRGDFHEGMVIEAVLAHALKQRGCDCTFFLCDMKFPVCDNKNLGHGSLSCRECYRMGRDYLNSFGLGFLPLSKYVSKGVIKKARQTLDRLPYDKYEDFSYEGIGLGKIAKFSTLRYLIQGSLDNSEGTRTLYKQFIYKGIIMVEASKSVLKEISADLVISSHGIYVNWGIFFEYARKLGLPVYIYSKGDISNTLLFHSNCSSFNIENIWAMTKHLSLGKCENDRLFEYLDSRKTHKNDYFRLNLTLQEDKEKIKKEFGLEGNRKIVLLFPSTLWDCVGTSQDRAFSCAVEWIMETVNYFIKKPQYYLVIRCHPYEVYGYIESRQKVTTLIRDTFENLPENIIIIEPNSSISSYALLGMADIILTYVSSMGLEASVRGFPVIFAGKFFHTDKGYSYDAKTKREYFDFLDNLDKVDRRLSEEQIELAKRYAFTLYFRCNIPADGFLKTENAAFYPAIQRLEELNPGKNRYLDLICDSILNGKEIYIPG